MGNTYNLYLPIIVSSSRREMGHWQLRQLYRRAKRQRSRYSTYLPENLLWCVSPHHQNYSFLSFLPTIYKGQKSFCVTKNSKSSSITNMPRTPVKEYIIILLMLGTLHTSIIWRCFEHSNNSCLPDHTIGTCMQVEREWCGTERYLWM